MGRGGARYGAGRPGWHVRVEDLRSIDVRQLRRDGILEANGGGVFVWRDGRHCSINFAADEIVLLHDLNGQSDEQPVTILRTTCHYGGSRPWFACPTCSRRVALLYLAKTGFACRRCAGANYTSQVEDATARAVRKQRKVEARIGTGNIRPVGMRWTTFSKLRSKLFKALSRQAAEIEGPANCKR